MLKVFKLKVLNIKMPTIQTVPCKLLVVFSRNKNKFFLVRSEECFIKNVRKKRWVLAKSRTWELNPSKTCWSWNVPRSLPRVILNPNILIWACLSRFKENLTPKVSRWAALMMPNANFPREIFFKRNLFSDFRKTPSKTNWPAQS